LNGTQSPSKTVINNKERMGYSSLHGEWIGRFIMAGCNSKVVSWSNSLNNYADSFEYKEAAIYPDFMDGFNATISGLIFMTCLSLPPLKWFLQNCILPKPGQGPSKEK